MATSSPPTREVVALSTADVGTTLDGWEFAPPQVFDVELESHGETPFLHVGPGAGLLGMRNLLQREVAVYTLVPR